MPGLHEGDVDTKCYDSAQGLLHWLWNTVVLSRLGPVPHSLLCPS